MKRWCLTLAVLAFAGGVTPALAQTGDASSVFRVFLKDGRALPSYGECAMLADRVVFTLIVGDGGVDTKFQLTTLPASAVDMARTVHYSDGVRAARYAATRGESDYAALTSEVSRAIDELGRIEDPKARLEAAERAKRRLLAWSRENYGYRAADIQVLAGLFDDVIAELRVAAGVTEIQLDLVAGDPKPVSEPLQPIPTLRQSIELALAAADVADTVVEREAILRAAASATNDAPALADLAAAAKDRLANEEAVDSSYGPFLTDLRTRADAALRRGDVRAIDALRSEAVTRDKALGARRPDDVKALLQQLEATLDRARVFRLALDHYAMMRPKLLDYERAVRPVLSMLDGARPALEAVKDMSGPSLDWLVQLQSNLTRMQATLETLTVPGDLSDVHATLGSAIRLALDAFARRNLAAATVDMAIAREASAAATGAAMLIDQARRDLVARLYPPKLQ